jgi:hypothetical protein
MLFLGNLYSFQHTTVHIIWCSCRLAVTRQLVEQALLPSGAHDFIFPTSIYVIVKLFLLLLIQLLSICHISIDPFCVVTDIHIYRNFHISHTSNFATFCYIVYACVLSPTMLTSFVVPCVAWFCMVFMFWQKEKVKKDKKWWIKNYTENTIEQEEYKKL